MSDFWDIFWENYYLNDEKIWSFYPYLKKYIIAKPGQKVLEVGFGSGWLARYLTTISCDYHGIETSKKALANLKNFQVSLGSALSIPFPDNTFDQVYSIGCLHHTGDIPTGLREIYRILKPGGCAVIMLYNKNSFRYRVFMPLHYLYMRFLKFTNHDVCNFPLNYKEYRRWYYDNCRDNYPENTDFITSSKVKRILYGCRKVTIHKENIDGYILPKNRFINCQISREWLLKTPIPHIVGLELYVTVIK